MKNKKGFTLVELLAVLVIMALLMTLAFPNFSSLTSKAKSNYDSSTKVLLRSAAKMYVSNNRQEVDEYLKSNTKYCLPVGKLIAYEYLDSDIKDVSENVIPNNKCINITKNGDDYLYNVDTNDTINSSADYLPPIITITGSNCKTIMNISSIDEFNQCIVKATDDRDAAKTFKNIREKEEILSEERRKTEMVLDKTVVQEDNKIFVYYNATDSSGNKSISLQVQLTLPE